MIITVSNRRVQQSDHSSQKRRGEHRLRQCLLHWCECETDLGYTAVSLGDLKSGFVFFSFHLPFWSQGYRQKDSYMASQGPLQHTMEDFWRMIWEWRSCSIVMLTELEERGQVGGRGLALKIGPLQLSLSLWGTVTWPQPFPAGKMCPVLAQRRGSGVRRHFYRDKKGGGEWELHGAWPPGHQ